MPGRDITVSVVSHRQNALVNLLFRDLQSHCADRIALVLTENVPDSTPLAASGLPFPAERIVNGHVKGFGANHNAAFLRCRTPFFCILNPDIRLQADPFPLLVSTLEDPQAGTVGPLVRSPSGSAEDSARRFPTAAGLLRKALREERQPDYPIDRGPQAVDWIGGMFMLLRSDAFRAVGGFDETYFLYYEDVDLCRRLHAAGKSVTYQPAAEVVHDARRGSRRNPRLTLHHLKSAFRFLSRR